MTYTIVLIIIIILNLFAGKLKKNLRAPFFLVSCFLLLGLLSGFRYVNEYSDFQVNYRRVIQAYSMNWNQVFHYSSEFFHQIFRKIIAIVFKDPQWYFIISSLFMVGSFMLCAKKYSPSLFLFVLLYYAVFSYFPPNNITRQGIAVAVTLYSWDFLIKKKPIPFFITILIATLFHTSAVFFALLYFLSSIRFTKNTFYAYILFAAALFVFNRPFIRLFQFFLYSDYVDGAYGTTGSNPLRLALAALAMFFMYVFLKSKNGNTLKNLKQSVSNRYDNFLLHGTFMLVICYILSTTSMLIIARLSLFYCPCTILCIINGIEDKKGTKNYLLYKYGVILFALLWFGVMNYSGKLIPTPYYPFWLFPSRTIIP